MADTDGGGAWAGWASDGRDAGGAGSRASASPAEQCYEIAGDIIEKVLAKRGSPKSLVLSHPHPDKRKLYAIVCETVKYADVIDELVRETPLADTTELPRGQLLALVHDLLFSRGIKCGGRSKAVVHAHKGKLKTALAAMRERLGVSSNRELLPASLQNPAARPRFARVNALRGEMSSVLAQLQNEGFQLVQPPPADLAALPPRSFCTDPHLPDLLVFAPKTDLHCHPLYEDGTLILQDKASCFPVHALAPAPDADCLDACAAPGNKTSHLASALKGGSGRIFAFDLDKKRLEVMERQLARAGAEAVECIHGSFLEQDPASQRFADVQFAIVDPSCSGSGMADRAGERKPARDLSAKDRARLHALASFQRSCILQAMRFPRMQRVAYSTCSVHEIENEDVVAAVLEEEPNFRLVHALPQWKRRGQPTAQLPAKKAAKVVRTDPAEDKTIGFFLAVFERRAGAAARKRAAGEDAGMQKSKRQRGSKDRPDKKEKKGEKKGEKKQQDEVKKKEKHKSKGAGTASAPAPPPDGADGRGSNARKRPKKRKPQPVTR